MPDLDHLAHLTRESARFRAALVGIPDETRVPSCPDWDAVDLLWHLAGVQWFWGEVVRQGVRETAVADALELPRPDSRPEVEQAYDDASRGLVAALSAHPPETPAWTWATDQSVGFIRRRQAHEALIHRVDAELAAGDRTALDPALAADGVDEVLRVMYGGEPGWGEFTPLAGHTVRVVATDAALTWVLTLGRFTGADPEQPEDAYEDEPDLRVAAVDDGAPVTATITGTAADLDCWLWHRPPVGPVERTGDAAVLAAFDETVAPGVN